MNPGRRALVLGATGLVGSWCVKFLLEDPDFAQVIAAGRSPLPAAPKLAFEPVDFERLAERPLPAADDVFCCLGTTRKKAGSAEAFRRVDFDYVLAAARAGRASGARNFYLVSSQGADASSPFLYPRVKGEIEAAVSGLGFESVQILRPGLLLGERTERRPLEAAALSLLGKLSFLLMGPLAGLKPIPARAVGHALVLISKRGERGTRIWPSAEIASLAAGDQL